MSHPARRRCALTGALLLGVLAAAAPPAAAVDGQVLTFGDDAFGQLGNGAAGSTVTPTAVLAGATRVAGGREHVLALRSGVVHAWGADSFGQIGNGDPIARVDRPVAVLSGARDVATGHLHSLALLQNGGVRVWGLNDKGQAGPAAGEATRVTRPSAVALPGSAAMVAGGRAHSIALVGGAVWTWGDNTNGQLGLGTVDAGRHPVPARVQGLPPVRFVAGGRDSTYAITTGGELWAWGRGAEGQLGTGTRSSTAVPVRVLTGVKQVEAGAVSTVAVRGDGSVWTWGDNRQGQLGRAGGTALRPARVPVPPVAKAYAGRDHVLALMSSGAVMAWGRNDAGQLGVAPSGPRSTPAVVPGLRGARDAGGGEKYSVVLD